MAGDIYTAEDFGRFMVEEELVDVPEGTESCLDYAKIGAEYMADNACANIIKETGKRKTTRYHSKNEPGGLFAFHEWGAACHRITHHPAKSFGAAPRSGECCGRKQNIRRYK